MKALAITGWSNSGKTTLIVDMIARCIARGERVAAIKHTHHEVNDRDEGDTARFRAAGASPVILAGDDVAVQWKTGASPVRVSRGTSEGALDLLALVDDADVVLIEGFKSFYGWPRIEAPVDVAEAMAILDRISPS
jgi:molybdopterin-guanine dinucleotide biosynthesis protein B